jgi:hypothetical protein
LAQRVNPPHIVDLLNQFGLEPNVNVELSKLVCVPTFKRVHPAAAGGAED